MYCKTGFFSTHNDDDTVTLRLRALHNRNVINNMFRDVVLYFFFRISAPPLSGWVSSPQTIVQKVSSFHLAAPTNPAHNRFKTQEPLENGRNTLTKDFKPNVSTPHGSYTKRNTLCGLIYNFMAVLRESAPSPPSAKQQPPALELHSELTHRFQWKLCYMQCDALCRAQYVPGNRTAFASTTNRIRNAFIYSRLFCAEPNHKKTHTHTHTFDVLPNREYSNGWRIRLW